MPNTSSKSWQSRADSAVIHGFTDLPSLKARGTTVIAQGDGPYVIDTDGKRYLDANAGLGNMIAGYAHPDLIAAAQKQYARLPGCHTFFDRMSDQTVELSERLIALSPFESGQVFYTNSASEANDTMVKMLWFMNKLRGMPTKRKIITRTHASHGSTAVSASMSGTALNDMFGLPLPEFVHVSCPHYWRDAQRGETEEEFTQRMAVELDQTIRREGAQTIAGFFAEPVMGAGGMIPPSDGYFQAISKVLRDHRIPLIVDEAITGLGRTGQFWGHETFAFEPDAIVTSKGLTAGYFPMSAIILGPEMAKILNNVIGEFDTFPHGFSTAGHPVGCAIALKTIDLLQDGLLENARALSSQFQSGLKALSDHANVGEWRGTGLMGAVEFVQDKDRKTPFDANQSVATRVANLCFEQGLMCRPVGQAITLCPPFILNKTQMDSMFATLGAAITQVFDEMS